MTDQDEHNTQCQAVETLRATASAGDYIRDHQVRPTLSSADDPTAVSSRPALLHRPIPHPLAKNRLQYLNAIPPSPPVDLANMNLFDPDGEPIVHPLQLDPEPVTAVFEGEDPNSPSHTSHSALSEKGLALALELGPAAATGTLPPTPRPPRAFIKRHGSHASHTSASGSQGTSSTCSSPSPLAGSPLTPTPPLIPSPVSMAVKSPLAYVQGEDREKRAMFRHLETM